MKHLFLLAIKTYWRLVPQKRRRKCLFKVSCSQYVYQQIKENGVSMGLRALHYRIQNCNDHYHIIEIEDEKVLVTKTHKIIRKGKLSDFILKKMNTCQTS
jgi:putative component of membrane protein insertase Oxa1/YidC/SpoIIIJ protein YidD